MTEAECLPIIQSMVIPHGLPWELVAAVCKVESSFNQWAFRYEPGFKYVQDNLGATERAGQMISWGLMQVMGAVARQYGYTGDLPRLCDPSVGLQYGMLHLKRFENRYGNWPDTIASYNAGRPVRGTDGKYYNQQYVDKVLKEWHQYETPIPLKETEA